MKPTLDDLDLLITVFHSNNPIHEPVFMINAPGPESTKFMSQWFRTSNSFKGVLLYRTN